MQAYKILPAKVPHPALKGEFTECLSFDISIVIFIQSYEKRKMCILDIGKP